MEYDSTFLFLQTLVILLEDGEMMKPYFQFHSLCGALIIPNVALIFLFFLMYELKTYSEMQNERQ